MAETLLVKKSCIASRVALCAHAELTGPSLFMSTSSAKLFYGFMLLLLYLIAVVHTEA